MKSWPVFIASALVLISLVMAGFAFIDRFHQGTKTRISICQSENDVRGILREEHMKKLRTAELFLKDHPNGTADFSVSFIKGSIADERHIVSQVQSLPCS